ncbi:hypothetical protein SteCoe_29518 [Stentor coeruleus]|uniref:EF-hand domain-containing protein n=1 Tax=Stentor coeruleus TaxID=5963 RepID=A0A1R2B5R8_9CILI|nr:hypothetical protein SteCoe_29518 [Stentor coeruleus]
MEPESNPRILVITIDISDQLKGNIIVHEKDNPDTLSEDFLKKYNLDSTMKKPLIQVIKAHQIKYQQQKKSLLSKILSQGNFDIKPSSSILADPHKTTSQSSSLLKKSYSSTKINYGQLLYEKGQKMKENKRAISETRTKEHEKESKKVLTFHPKICKNTNEIIKNAETERKSLKNYENMTKLHIAKEEKEMKECYFIPQISEKSSRISEGKNIFDSLYKDACLRRGSQDSFRSSSKDQEKNSNFRRKSEGVEEFVERLTNSKKKTEEELERIRKEKEVDVDKETGQKLFIPKTGRKPNSVRRERPVWDELYSSRNATKEKIEEKKLQENEKYYTQPSESSCKLFEKFKFSKFESLFKTLDSDNDGKISAERINLHGIDIKIIMIISPILEELEIDRVKLKFEDFLTRIDSLYAKITPQDKMLLVKSNSQVLQENYSFIPKINKKSKMLAANNTHLGNNVFERSSAAREIHDLKMKKARELQELGKMNNIC